VEKTEDLKKELVEWGAKTDRAAGLRRIKFSLPMDYPKTRKRLKIMAPYSHPYFRGDIANMGDTSTPWPDPSVVDTLVKERL